MTHNEVWEAFKKRFSYASNCATYWFPNGKNSIRIRFPDGKPDLIFTYQNMKVWKIETVDSYLESTKVEAK